MTATDLDADSAAVEDDAPGGQGVVLGLLMATTALGISAPAVALPGLAELLDQPVAALAWVLAAYALALAIATAVAGRLVDIVGTHRTLYAGVALMAAGSVIAVLGPDLLVVVAGRLVQGAGAGAVSVVVLTVATRRPPAHRGAVLGAMTATVAIVSGAGPLIGGALATGSPRLALVLPVLGVLFVRAALRGVPRTRVGGRVDLVGAGLLTAAVGGLLLVVQARSTGVPLLLALALFAIAATSGVLLMRHTRQHPEGFLPRELISRPGLGLVVASGAAIMAAYLAVLFVAPILLRQQGFGPLATGAVLLPAAVVGALSSRLTGRIVHRRAPLPVAGTLAALAAAGLVVGAVAGGRPVGVVTATALVLAAFSGGQVAVVTSMSMLTDDAVRGLALGLQNLGLLLGGALGTAAAGAVTDLDGARTALAVLVPVPLLGIALSRLAARRTAA